MKKKVVELFVFGILVIASLGFVSGEACDLDVELINQDPYPAVPGEYVKVVFQLSGVSNTECGDISFELIEGFPFSLDPGASSIVKIASGTYVRNFESSLIVPYELRVDKDALDGNNPIDVAFYYTGKSSGKSTKIQQFNINVEDVSVDFEISVKEYDSSTNILTFEILNTGKNDIEALTIEIPKQEGVIVKGSNRNIIGDLDSNEDTTAKFEAVPSDGEIEVSIIYTDGINVRRRLNTKVVYDSFYFTERKKDEATSRSFYFYAFFGLLILWAVLWGRKRWKKKKLRESERRLRRK
ncbi:MAG: hypothetical protein KJ600_02795 [Nanoarchaeota archaeon]|nr:hypothetical protein [Nanoarchaeota archaeon]MBU1103458.1 hypothetical protein [Nanoarchaeota archaeon]